MKICQPESDTIWGTLGQWFAHGLMDPTGVAAESNPGDPAANRALFAGHVFWFRQQVEPSTYVLYCLQSQLLTQALDDVFLVF